MRREKRGKRLSLATDTIGKGHTSDLSRRWEISAWQFDIWESISSVFKRKASLFGGSFVFSLLEMVMEKGGNDDSTSGTSDAVATGELVYSRGCRVKNTPLDFHKVIVNENKDVALATTS